MLGRDKAKPFVCGPDFETLHVRFLTNFIYPITFHKQFISGDTCATRTVIKSTVVKELQPFRQRDKNL